jgi:hypothetical protein
MPLINSDEIQESPPATNTQADTTDIASILELAAEDFFKKPSEIPIKEGFGVVGYGDGENDFFAYSKPVVNLPITFETKQITKTNQDDLVSADEVNIFVDFSPLKIVGDKNIATNFKIETFDGNDVINSGFLNDIIDAGNGDDTIYAIGEDQITTGSGKDVIMLNSNGFSTKPIYAERITHEEIPGYAFDRELFKDKAYIQDSKVTDDLGGVITFSNIAPVDLVYPKILDFDVTQDKINIFYDNSWGYHSTDIIKDMKAATVINKTGENEFEVVTDPNTIAKNQQNNDYNISTYPTNFFLEMPPSKILVTTINGELTMDDLLFEDLSEPESILTPERLKIQWQIENLSTEEAQKVLSHEDFLKHQEYRAAIDAIQFPDVEWEQWPTETPVGLMEDGYIPVVAPVIVVTDTAPDINAILKLLEDLI